MLRPLCIQVAALKLKLNAKEPSANALKKHLRARARQQRSMPEVSLCCSRPPLFWQVSGWDLPWVATALEKIASNAKGATAATLDSCLTIR